MTVQSVVVLTDSGIHVCSNATGATACQLCACADYAMPATLFDDVEWSAMAEAIAHLVIEHDLPTTLTLVVPLNWVFTHLLTSTNTLITAHSLSFDFEQFLPVPLETLTCAFIPFDNGRILATGITTTPVTKLLDALREQGLCVQRLTVDVLAVGLAGHDADHAHTICDTRWERTWLGYTVDPHRCVALAARSDRPHAQGVEILNLADHDANTAAHIASAALATHEQFDLCVDALAPAGQLAPKKKLMLHCGWCAVALLGVVTVVLYGHQQVLQNHRDQVTQAQLACYQAVFDAEHLPIGAELRLASEAKRLDSLTRPAASSATAALSNSAPLDLLREWAAGLPADLRIDLVHTRLDDQQWTLRGKTAAHRDAERLVDVINSLPGVTARPPRTSRLESGGVEFSILATVKAES